MLAVADIARDGHAAHGSDLEIHDRGINGLVVRSDCSSGGVIVVDQFIRSDTQRGVNLVSYPRLIGNDQKS